MQMQHPDVLFFSVPNGGWLAGNATQRAGQMNKLKGEGLLPGVSDLFIAEPRGHFHGMFLEMKAPGGKPSENQMWFMNETEKRGYFTCCALNGFDDAKSFAEYYLSLRK
jgi:hypothetical protein